MAFELFAQASLHRDDSASEHDSPSTIIHEIRHHPRRTDSNATSIHHHGPHNHNPTLPAHRLTLSSPRHIQIPIIIPIHIHILTLIPIPIPLQILFPNPIPIPIPVLNPTQRRERLRGGMRGV